ncbi:SHOCT domain-containing protein [Parascardovia denticolens]|nr:SHOCT domain-containing protein [Parascardovia denticolens]
MYIQIRSTERPSTPSPAPDAAERSRLTGTGTGSTARTPAISQPGSKAVIAMSDEQFEREKLYQASMEMFKKMLDQDLITEEEYAVIDTKMKEKYRPIIGTLLSP